MLVVGLQGSPRKKGNTDYLLDRFLEQAAPFGAETVKIQVAQKNILPCIGCNSCMKTGECVLKTDDMFNEIYALLQKADVIVAATPVFFYGPSAQLKALIDRSQTLWSRKYALKIHDARAKTRKGFLLSVGATGGNQLFDGITLIAKYFFDAAGATYSGALTFRKVDQAGELKKLPDHLDDIAESARALFEQVDWAQKRTSKGVRMANPEEIYQCQTASCGYMYNPDKGDRKGKIKKGTAFADLPDDWKCPVCGAGKKMFRPLGGPDAVR